VRRQLPILIYDHDRLRARGDVRVHAFLHARRPAQLDIARRGNISRLVRTADRACRRASIWVRAVAHDRDISLGNRFFQSLILAFRDVDGQFFGLQSKARIGHFHVTAEDADVFIGIKERVIRVNLSRDRAVGWRALNSTEQGICFVRRLFFFFFLLLCAGRRWTG